MLVAAWRAIARRVFPVIDAVADRVAPGIRAVV